MKNVIQAAVILFAASAAQAQQAVQWKVSDGGNGHWYRVDVVAGGVSWSAARAAAEGLGGHLASIRSAAEDDFVRNVISVTPGAVVPESIFLVGPWIGGTRDPVSGGFSWISGESWQQSSWCPGEPTGPAWEDCVHYWSSGLCWNDRPGNYPGHPSFVVEWSADCNGDGLVDYGQVRQGQLPDANSNGVPDGCECASVPTLPACCVGDLNQDSAVDGADLGNMLNAWGTCPTACPADLDRNGFVDGADLGVMLGRWGSCGT